MPLTNVAERLTNIAERLTNVSMLLTNVAERLTNIFLVFLREFHEEEPTEDDRRLKLS
jgi:hypothetical protein